MSERANEAETTRIEPMAGRGGDFGAAETVQFGAVAATTAIRTAGRQPESQPPLFGGTSDEIFRSTPTGTPASPGPSAPTPSSGGSKKALIVGAVVVVLAAVGVGAGVFMMGSGGGSKPAAGSSQQDVESAIRNYYGVLRDNGMTAASAISCKEVRDITDRMAPPDSANDMKQDVTIDKIANVKIDHDLATADLTGHARSQTDGGQTIDNPTETNPVRLKHEDGQWKMCTTMVD